MRLSLMCATATVRFSGHVEAAIMLTSARIYQGTIFGGLILLHAVTASAQEPSTDPASNTPSPPAAQVVYKGVVGNLLESMPLESADRVRLQRASALLSNPLSFRSIAVALGLASPPLMLAGLIWGLWSAAKIEPTKAAAQGTSPVAAHSSHLDVVHEGSTGAPPQREAVQKLETRIVATSALAGVVGGSGPADRGVPCDNCYTPILDFRPMPIIR
jgi:hypothetical protein